MSWIVGVSVVDSFDFCLIYFAPHKRELILIKLLTRAARVLVFQDRQN